jgi:phosphoadenosine phosphosulfate reductase
MQPLYEAMRANGVTCIIRGKRHDEADKTPVSSGFVSPDGIEIETPIFNWTKADVLDYLRDNNIPLPSFYEHAGHSLDCMDCTAWWGEGLSKFLAAKYPAEHGQYVQRIQLIKSAVSAEMSNCEV